MSEFTDPTPSNIIAEKVGGSAVFSVRNPKPCIRKIKKSDDREKKRNYSITQLYTQNFVFYLHPYPTAVVSLSQQVPENRWEGDMDQRTDGQIQLG